jgi:phosphate transport system substrate-binding protein
MADAVKNTSGSIGYVELQYAQHDNIQYGLVLNPSGSFVKASPATITAACQAVEAPRWEKFSASLTNAPGSDSFPISSFTWVYLRTKPSDPRRAAALLRLLNWIFTDGQPLGAQLGYSELPKQILENAKIKVNSLSLAGAKVPSKVQNQSHRGTGTSQSRRPANAAMKQQFSFF